MTVLQQAWPPPTQPRPIVIIGTGGIVCRAHLPVYRRIGFPIAGLFDIRPDVARAAAAESGVDTVFDSLERACGVPGAVFDLAVPGDQIGGILDLLPPGAAVLIQKPLGVDLPMARAILACCRERRLTAAVNFQLRFSPNVLAAADAIARGWLGDLVDVDVRLVVDQPWARWTFLQSAPRLEVLYHSIHYLDTIRRLLGEPLGVYCRAVRHPDLPELADTRSSIVLDYGDAVRCSLALNHTHRQDRSLRTSSLTIEGTAGAAALTMGVNLDYPNGPADTLAIARAGGPWTPVPLRGSWFIEAFEGPMSNLQRFVAGEDVALVSPVEDAIRTMAVVEACYESSAHGATPVPDLG
jgi:predicted dehydrogenase